jgi:hypothetical protein
VRHGVCARFLRHLDARLERSLVGDQRCEPITMPSVSEVRADFRCRTLVFGTATSRAPRGSRI